MILVMAYAALLSACLAAAAAALEPLCRALRAATRWVWVWGLALTLAATGVTMLLPSNAVQEIAMPVAASTELTVAGSRRAPSVEVANPVWKRAGVAAGVLWAGASLLMLGALAGGAWRLARERHLAGRSHVQGHFVLLTDGVGPAVAGVRDPVALIPRWVLELDDTSQRLLLTHEMEHVRARDSALLVFGAMLAALLPWNPLVWWMLRRLRLAVEVDCDHRVLEREGGVRRYAELLLMTARMPSEHARALVAGLGERESDLERRIVAMTESTQASMRPVLSRAVVPAVLASALIVAACETPRPDPVGPSALGLAAGAMASREDSVAGRWLLHEGPARSFKRQGDSVVDLVELRAERPHYHFRSGETKWLSPDSLKFEEVEVKASAVRPRVPLREQEVRLPAPRLPARLRSGPDMIEQKKAGSAPLSRSTPTIVLRDPTAQVELVKPSAGGQPAPLEIHVLSSDGRLLATEHHKSPPSNGTLLSRFDPQQLESIEVVKQGVACLARRAPTEDRCHRITITLKPGATFRAR